MRKQATTAVVLGIILAAQPLSDVSGALAQAGYPGPQQRAPGWHGRPGVGPHVYPGWNGGPGWRGAAPWRGPMGWRGRPYWFGRPWAPRPYYETIIAGVALGTLITVAAIGVVPVRPAPDLCWYWADPYGNQGYWDYCA